MDADRLAIIAHYSARAHDARERYKLLGMANTPSDPDKAKAQRIEYDLARAASFQADAELENSMLAERGKK